MMSKSPTRQPDPLQSERFKEAARSLGADENEAAFKAKLAVIARHKPKPEVKSTTKGTDDGKKHGV
jgi:hypothetical protein